MPKQKSYNTFPRPTKTFAISLLVCAALSAFAAFALYDPSFIEDNPLAQLLRIKAPTKPLLFAILLLASALLALTNARISNSSFHNGAFAGPRPAKDNSRGNARLLSKPSTLRAAFSVWSKDNPSPPAGLVVGGIGANRSKLLVKEIKHALVLGSTGAGKSVTCLFPTIANIISAGANAIVLDPKEECFALFAEYARINGYKVIHLDFSRPRCSDGWNPLDGAIDCANARNGRTRDELAGELRRLACTLIPDEKKSGSKVWIETARILFRGAAALIVEKEGLDERERNLASVATIVNLSQEEVAELAEALPIDSTARVPLLSMAKAAPETYAGYLTNLNSKLDPFTDPGVVLMTDHCDITANMLADPDEKVLVFIGYDGTSGEHTPLITAFISSMMRDLSQIARNSTGLRLPKPVYWLLEEFGQLPPMDDLPRHLMIMRSTRQHAVVVAQSVSAIEDAYGKQAASAIIDNLETTVFLSTNSLNTAETLSRKLGCYTYESINHSARESWSQTESGSTTSMQSARLLQPEDLLKWDWRTGHLIIDKGQAYACSSLAIQNSFVGDELGLNGEEPTGETLAHLTPEKQAENNGEPHIWIPSRDNRASVTADLAKAIETTERVQPSARAFDPRVM